MGRLPPRRGADRWVEEGLALDPPAARSHGPPQTPEPEVGHGRRLRTRMGRIEGLRAWLAQLDRNLGIRTYVLGAIAVLGLAASAVALVLVLQLKQDSVSKDDVAALQDQLSTVSDEASQAAEEKVQSLERPAHRDRDRGRRHLGRPVEHQASDQRAGGRDRGQRLRAWRHGSRHGRDRRRWLLAARPARCHRRRIGISAAETAAAGSRRPASRGPSRAGRSWRLVSIRYEIRIRTRPTIALRSPCRGDWWTHAVDHL